MGAERYKEGGNFAAKLGEFKEIKMSRLECKGTQFGS